MNEMTRKTLEQVVDECGRFPLEAFEFVRTGLNYTVQKIHGQSNKPDQQCHISGQELCRGLREYAILRYGLMAQAVFHHWNIKRTNDFGKIVFAMVESKLMQKTEDDDLEDFSEVYDFDKAFNAHPRPSIRPLKPSFEL